MQDRPYQSQGLDSIRLAFAQGHRKVLLHLPTGGGKTYMFSQMLKAADTKGTRSIMVVKGRELVEQASQRLFREHVNHGVRMANHWNRRYGALTQVCSIDTLMARREFPEAVFIVVDEAHLLTSDKCVEFFERYPDAYILAVTATPYGDKSLRHLADVVVAPITMCQLIEQRYLMPARVYAPSAPDLRGVHTRNGDFVSEELEEKMKVLTGDLVEHWRTLGEGRLTISFAVNIRHSRSIVAQFNAAGIPAEHIEGDTPPKERERALAKLKSGSIKILSNVGVLCTGVDLPFVSCLILARPTKSYNLYIQQCGRGTRPCAEISKEDFRILDHAGNTLRHGFITQEREVDLDGRKATPKILQPKTCLKCFGVYVGSQCPECGPIEKEDRPEVLVEHEAGVLAEIKHLPEAVEISIFVDRMRKKQKSRGYKQGWLWHQVKDKFGEDVANQIKTMRPRPSWMRSGG